LSNCLLPIVHHLTRRTFFLFLVKSPKSNVNGVKFFKKGVKERPWRTVDSWWANSMLCWTRLLLVGLVFVVRAREQDGYGSRTGDFSCSVTNPCDASAFCNYDEEDIGTCEGCPLETGASQDLVEHACFDLGLFNPWGKYDCVIVCSGRTLNQHPQLPKRALALPKTVADERRVLVVGSSSSTISGSSSISGSIGSSISGSSSGGSSSSSSITGNSTDGSTSGSTSGSSAAVAVAGATFVVTAAMTLMGVSLSEFISGPHKVAFVNAIALQCKT
jgi:hypothetical protein